jgi:general secretion pathway protein E
MIGEIRDLETAEIAVQSALTGHLVFSTLHTNDAPSAITRLMDIGVERFLLSSTIRGILAQRLVRIICPHCRDKDASEVNREERDLFEIGPDVDLFLGKGCDTCTHTGYYGRTGVFELLVVDDAMQRLILRNADANELRKLARDRGMKTLFQDGSSKIRAGITTLNEVYRVTQEV